MAGAFQHFYKLTFAKLCGYYAVAGYGYGMIYMSALLVCLKSVSIRHRAKMNGFCQCLFLMGAWTTKALNAVIFRCVCVCVCVPVCASVM